VRYLSKNMLYNIMEVWLMWCTVMWYCQVQTLNMHICMMLVHSTDLHQPLTGRMSCCYFGRPIMQVNCDNTCFWNTHAQTLSHFVSLGLVHTNAHYMCTTYQWILSYIIHLNLSLWCSIRLLIELREIVSADSVG
jgi:hypothetical protein